MNAPIVASYRNGPSVWFSAGLRGSPKPSTSITRGAIGVGAGLIVVVGDCVGVGVAVRGNEVSTVDKTNELEGLSDTNEVENV